MSHSPAWNDASVPPSDERLVLYCWQGEVWLGFYDADGWNDLDGMLLAEGTVTHWMELPEPPIKKLATQSSTE